MGGGFAEQVETFFFAASYSGYADEHADETRKAGDGELLDTHRHLGVDVVGINL